MSLQKRKYDTNSEIEIYFKRINIDSSYSYHINENYIDSLSTSKFALNTYKLEHNGIASPVQLRMYNTKSGFIYGWEQCFGDLTKLEILDGFPFVKKTHLPVNQNLLLANELELLNISYEEKESLMNKIEEYDYVIFAYWAKWTGWWSKDSLKRINEYVKNNSDSNILLVKLNVTRKNR